MNEGTDWSALIAGYAATAASWTAIRQFWMDRPRLRKAIRVHRKYEAY